MRGACRTLGTWLEQPLSEWWCALGWLVATAIFIGIIQALGGPFIVDSQQSTDSTLAIAHGQLRCAFPSGPELTAPLYPFLSGAIVAASRLGHTVAFPSGAELGAHCDKAFNAIDTWTGQARVLQDLLRIGYVGWLFLLVGLVIFLRTCGRGRSGWEPATVILVACLPPVWLTLESSFHPQDLIAMGLALCAMACALSGTWVLAGILVAIAVFFQQFAILVAIPLLLLAPTRRRWAYLGGAVGTGAIAVIFLFGASSSRAVGAALIGTGNTTTSDSLVMTLHLHGAPLVLLSRVLPMVLSVVLSWWVARHLVQDFDPTTLVSLVALSLSLRLAFEQNMFGYYFMALVVCLVVLDVIAGRFRRSLVAWLLMLTVTYLAGPTTTFVQLDRVSWGKDAQQWMAPIVVVIALVMILLLLRRKAPTSEVVVWLALLVGAVLVWPSTRNPASLPLSRMFWQIVLVVLGIALAATPLAAALRRVDPEHDTKDTPAIPTTAVD
jgi:hypothetical protein